MSIIRFILRHFYWWRIYKFKLKGAPLKLFHHYTALDGTRYMYLGDDTYFRRTEKQDWDENLKLT
jgi:hypothetical protein